MTNLITRLLAGPGSRELDAEIAVIECPFLADLPRTETGGWLDPKDGHIAPPSYYTTSLDAAVSFAVAVVGEKVAPLVFHQVWVGVRIDSYAGWLDALPRYIVAETLKARGDA